MTAEKLKRLKELQADSDLGTISKGHVCKHHIRWPHRCHVCDELAWERHRLEVELEMEG